MAQQVDLTKLNMDGNQNAFKNNIIRTGSFSISGSSSAGGVDTRTNTVLLGRVPDLLQIVFNGPTDTSGLDLDPRPSDAWFETGAVWVLGNNAGAGYTDYPLAFELSAAIVNDTAVISATNIKQFTDVLTLTAVTVYYRIIDYSVF